MTVAIVTGCNGLVGQEVTKQLLEQGYEVIGLDNDSRRKFFGEEGSTFGNESRHRNFQFWPVDVCETEQINDLFEQYRSDITTVIHTAAQPAHEWATGHILADFDINARATVGLLNATHRYSPDAFFVHCSSSKIYGDHPNNLPFIEYEKRFDLPERHVYYNGLLEDLPVDQSIHSFYGCSKYASDLYVQEFGRYFGLKTAAFRPGCLTGPGHKGVPMHGFLSYLVKCGATGIPYTILGHKGKQVRDNIHAVDFAKALILTTTMPKYGEVYNFGGGRYSNCSTLEAIDMIQEVTGRPMNIQHDSNPRKGDHIWYIGSTEKFLRHYPSFTYQYSQEDILREMVERATR